MTIARRAGVLFFVDIFRPKSSPHLLYCCAELAVVVLLPCADLFWPNQGIPLKWEVYGSEDGVQELTVDDEGGYTPYVRACVQASVNGSAPPVRRHSGRSAVARWSTLQNSVSKQPGMSNERPACYACPIIPHARMIAPP
jgi:hypothetical protein